MGSIPRSVGGRFALELDGAAAGFVKSVEGGDISADVVAEPVGQQPFAKKHIGNVKYEEFTLGMELGMSADVYEWIAGSWAGTSTRRNGAIVEADANLEVKMRREFRDALVTETTVPALDASAKSPAELTVRVAPDSITRTKGSGKLARAAAKQKQWLVANFRLELGDLDAKTVSKIDAFTVKQTVAADGLGARRDHRREPGTIEFPNLRVTLAESGAQTWNDWFDDFVVKGNNGDDREKNGSIVFLDPSLKQELGRVDLKNVGIFALRRPSPAGDRVARVTAELYVESMELNWKSFSK
ncbi:MAG TPA: phage tail protein [Gaiellaceae bacterium]|nr:phage tail protein [Gaiellaceae bacterium]